MPALAGPAKETTKLTERTNITSATQFQGPSRNTHRRDSTSLRAALLHSAQLKLSLRRAQREEKGFYRSKCLSRLLEATQYLEKSVAWLDSEAETELALAIHYAGGVFAGGLQ